jgi:hypothetical protein
MITASITVLIIILIAIGVKCIRLALRRPEDVSDPTHDDVIDA